VRAPAAGGRAATLGRAAALGAWRRLRGTAGGRVGGGAGGKAATAVSRDAAGG
jgi:hypothetical protein